MALEIMQGQLNIANAIGGGKNQHRLQSSILLKKLCRETLPQWKSPATNPYHPKQNRSRLDSKTAYNSLQTMHMRDKEIF